MEIVIVYSGLKKFRTFLTALRKKYKAISKVTVIFPRRVNTSVRIILQRMGISDVRFVVYSLSLSLIHMQNISRGNKVDLALVVTDKTKKRTLKRAKSLRSITAVYDLSSNKADHETLKENKYLICDGVGECTVNDVDVLSSVYFNKPVYGCRYSSCLGKKLYVDALGNVSFCIRFAEQTRVGKVDDEVDYFQSPIFIEVLSKEIEKRNNCKTQCSLARFCKGGCAMADECEKIKEWFSRAKEIDKMVRAEEADLSQINLALKSVVLERAFSKRGE